MLIAFLFNMQNQWIKQQCFPFNVNCTLERGGISMKWKQSYYDVVWRHAATVFLHRLKVNVLFFSFSRFCSRHCSLHIQCRKLPFRSHPLMIRLNGIELGDSICGFNFPISIVFFLAIAFRPFWPFFLSCSETSTISKAKSKISKTWMND